MVELTVNVRSWWPSSVPPLTENDDRQRLIHRSAAFATVPTVVAAVLAVNLIWSVIRSNLDADTLDDWPYKFTLTDTSAAATLLVAVVSLVIARSQWAHANRPSIGFGIDDEGQVFSKDSTVWRFWIYNAGPANAIVRRFEYRIVLQGKTAPTLGSPWVSLDAVNATLDGAGLEDGVTHHIRWIGGGFPLAPNIKYDDGSRFAWMTVDALAQLRRLDVRVVVEDGMGDIHECVFPVMDRLPSVTTEAIRAL